MLQSNCIPRIPSNHVRFGFCWLQVGLRFLHNIGGSITNALIYISALRSPFGGLLSSLTG